jgi:uncharacterized protein YdeI (YjbR/CyaY-like superfamily)
MIVFPGVDRRARADAGERVDDTENRHVTETPELLVPDTAAWRAWLAANHATSSGVRLVLAKKGVTEPTRLTYDDALPEALCYGWIDGQLTRRDEGTYCVRFTPRRARSAWSKRNVETVERLIAEGRMQPAGLVEVERARADGRWDRAYAGSASIDVPDDLRDALAASPRAQAMWDVLTRTNRYAVLYRVHEAKRAETRARRIREYVEMLARGDTPHPQQAKPAGGSSQRGRRAAR